MKKALKIGLLVLGGLLLLTGLVWIGQGTGYFPYPRSSIMISQMPWAYRGIGLVVVGVAAIVVSRRP
jgi:hypothetical protein